MSSHSKQIPKKEEANKEAEMEINVDEPDIPPFHEDRDTKIVIPEGKPLDVDEEYDKKGNKEEFEHKHRRIDEVQKMSEYIGMARDLIHNEMQLKKEEEAPKNPGEFIKQ